MRNEVISRSRIRELVSHSLGGGQRTKRLGMAHTVAALLVCVVCAGGQDSAAKASAPAADENSIEIPVHDTPYRVRENWYDDTYRHVDGERVRLTVAEATLDKLDITSGSGALSASDVRLVVTGLRDGTTSASVRVTWRTDKISPGKSSTGDWPSPNGHAWVSLDGPDHGQRLHCKFHLAGDDRGQVRGVAGAFSVPLSSETRW